MRTGHAACHHAIPRFHILQSEMMRIRYLTIYAVLVFVGCRRPVADDDDPGPAPPAAAEIAARVENLSLDQKLGLMQAEIEAALKQNLKGSSLTRIYRAEAISDRLLEAPPPVGWLRDSYDPQTRLRQVQALADRCVAE